jgi:hypothetical protein
MIEACVAASCTFRDAVLEGRVADTSFKPTKNEVLNPKIVLNKAF